MGLPRVAPRGGVTIGDRTLPEGTTVSVNPWVMHHSPELWGDDARVFNPDRWLREGAALRERYWVSVSTCLPACVPRLCLCVWAQRIQGSFANARPPVRSRLRRVSRPKRREDRAGENHGYARQGLRHRARGRAPGVDVEGVFHRCAALVACVC